MAKNQVGRQGKGFTPAAMKEFRALQTHAIHLMHTDPASLTFGAQAALEDLQVEPTVWFSEVQVEDREKRDALPSTIAFIDRARAPLLIEEEAPPPRRRTWADIGLGNLFGSADD